ncbi:MAG: class I SAM-dependent methyltransferase [Fidelibacterota bacterium]
MVQDAEQIDPFDTNNSDYWIKIEHLGRYLFVKNFLLSHREIDVVMDIAAGYGYGTELLSKISGKVISLENNPEMLKQLNLQFQNVQTIDVYQHDLERENLLQKKQLQKADLIVSFETLEHLENPWKNIIEFYEILRGEGYLILSVPNERFEKVDAGGVPKSEFHKTLLKKEDIENYLQDTGFKIVGKYGQALLNSLMKKENKLLRNRIIRNRFSAIETLHERKNMMKSACLFAYPDEENIEESYSRIYIAQKVEK